MGTHVPHYRLSAAEIGSFFGQKAKDSTRSVAAYDEDTTTMAVAAARQAYRSAATASAPSALWFATTFPTYAEKSNAAVVHAALQLPRNVAALDIGSSNRSGLAALAAACRSADTIAVAAADMRFGQPNSPDEAQGADAGAAFVVGEDSVIAEFLGSAAVTEELVDRWRIPGETRTRQWEERFGETRYGAIGLEILDALQDQLGLSRGEIAHLVITGQSPRAVATMTKRVGASADVVTSSIGNSGCVQPLLALSSALEAAKPGDIVMVVHLSDGADAVAFKATDAIGGAQPKMQLGKQISGGDSSLRYSKYLGWRGLLNVEPPRRPEPARVSSPAASRREAWKFGFVGSQSGNGSGDRHLPPQRVAFGASGDGELVVDDMAPIHMADVHATIATFTVDRLVYSQSPPVIFAIVDFDGGGRFPVELTDCAPDDVHIGDRVEMTFRKLSTSDGIANYFWKARLMTDGGLAATNEKDQSNG